MSNELKVEDNVGAQKYEPPVEPAPKRKPRKKKDPNAGTAADDTARQLLNLLENASPELQTQIVDHLGRKINYNPNAVGQKKPLKRKRKRPNPGAVVSAFGNVVHPEGWEPIPPEGITDKDGGAVRNKDGVKVAPYNPYGAMAQAWLDRWEGGDLDSSRKAVQRKDELGYDSAEEAASVAQEEFDTSMLETGV